MLVFIVGASRGIGAGAAEAFAARGVDLFITARDIKQLEKLRLKLISKYRIKCDISTIEVTDKDSIIEAAEKCTLSLGIPDIVLHNSGISKTDSFANFDSQIIRDVFEVNVFGIMNTLEIFIPLLMNHNGGTIAAVTSLAEARGIPGNAAYSSSKMAASHLLEAARCQLFNSNVKIATIKPGFIKTDMTSKNSFPMPFLLTADQAGEIIAEKLIDGKLRIAFPIPMVFISWFAKLIPSAIYDFFMKFWKKRMLQD